MDEPEELWVVDFYDFQDRLRLPESDATVHEFGDVYAQADRNGARHGTPLLMSLSHGPDARINLFFRASSVSGKRRRTWRRYAFTLVVWLNFLAQRERSWFEAATRDYYDFKYWRMADSRNPSRVGAMAFDTDRAALSTFYRWASGEYGVHNPIPAQSAQGESAGSRGRGRRMPDRPAGSPRRDVKWLLRQAFEQWRDVGLRGYEFDGRRPDLWRGFNEDRDAAFVDGLWGTGLRLTEWSSVLDVELPAADVPGRYPKAWLATECAKGGRYGREYRIPRGVLKSIAGYMDPVEGSRREAIERAHRAGRYERLGDVQIVTGHNPRSRTIHVTDGHGSGWLSLNVLKDTDRLRLFRRTPTGLEPLAVWLSSNGMPRQAHSWEKTFRWANQRVATAWVRAGAPLLGDGPWVGSAAHPCPLWARPHMLRHSFALRWYAVLSAVWNERLAGYTDAEKRAFREQFGDIWYQLATLLGHRSPETTRDWYLEPFLGLEVDYLMDLLDADERTAVDGLLKRVAGESELVLSAVVPSHDADGDARIQVAGSGE